MKRMWFLVFLALMIMCHATTSVPPPPQVALHRGFGAHINWRTYRDACEDSAKTGKPVMILFHQKWCKACRLLMPSFSQSPHIAKMAPLFEMVNLMDEEEPLDAKFQPDGLYYPRILFMGADGVVRNEIRNPDVLPNEPYQYYHAEAITVAKAMMKAIHTFYKVEEAGENEL